MRRFIPLLVLLVLTMLCFAAPAAAADNPPTFDPTVCNAFTDGGPLSEQCQQMIAAYPVPPVTITFMCALPSPTPRRARPEVCNLTGGNAKRPGGHPVVRHPSPVPADSEWVSPLLRGSQNG